VKGMARRTFDIHLTKTMNLPSRIKRMASNRQRWLW
jgi:hypothetical protein